MQTRPSPIPDRNNRIGCYVAGALGLAVVVAFLIPILVEPKRHPSGIAGCRFNLKQLGLSMIIYAEDHDGLLPPALLNELTINGVRHRGEPERFWAQVGPYSKNRSILQCPADKRGNVMVSYEHIGLPGTVKATPSGMEEASRIKLIRDIVWLGANGKPKSFHPNQTVNVLFGDGHVKRESVSDHRPVAP